MKKRFILILLLVFLVVFVRGDVYVGTTDGYIFDTDGKLVQGASVSVSVNNCNSGSGCSQVATSDTGGYYVVANLNLPSYGNVTVDANKGPAFGSKTDSANQFQAASINVIICQPPSDPVLTSISDTHLTSVTASWVSGIDFKGYSTFDQYRLDSNPEQTSNSPKTLTGLNYTVHTWRVRTCNNYCCSNWVGDTFNVFDNAPSKPVLNPQSDTSQNSVTLSWVSGVDPDGDNIFDEYNFSLIGNIVSPAVSPQTETNLSGGFTWKVRTCELGALGLCSNWSDSSFVVCSGGFNIQSCPVCSSVSDVAGSWGNGGRKWVGIEPVVCEKPLLRLAPEKVVQVSPVLVLTIPDIIRKNEFQIGGSFSTQLDLDNVIFTIESPDGFVFSDYRIDRLGAFNRSRFILKGTNNMKNGVYDLTFDVFIDGQKIIAEPFQLTVKKINYWLYILLIILLVTIYLIIHFWRKKRKKKLASVIH